MTPPENTERTSGAGGSTETTESAAPPPWQRAAEEVAAVGNTGSTGQTGGTGNAGNTGNAADTSAAAVGSTGEGGGPAADGVGSSASDGATQPFSAGVSSDEVPWRKPGGEAQSGGGMPDAGSPIDSGVVSGTAAGRMFGKHNEATVQTPIVHRDMPQQAPQHAQQHMPPPASQHAPPPAAPQQPAGAYAGRSAGVAEGGKARSTPVSALRRPGRGPRRASLQVKRIDPWSVLKLSLVLGVALFFVWMVAVGLLYTVLDGMGVWDSINGTYSSLVEADSESNAAADPLISVGRVFGVAGIIGAINIVLISALTTVCAFLYNVSADMAGGLEITLSERE